MEDPILTTEIGANYHVRTDKNCRFSVPWSVVTRVHPPLTEKLPATQICSKREKVDEERN